MNAFDLKDDVLAFIVEAAKDCGMSEVILYGSRATGRFTEKSDIDLAASGERYHDFVEVLDEHCPTLLQFDFVDLSNSLTDMARDLVDTIINDFIPAFDSLQDSLEKAYPAEVLDMF